MAKKTLHASKNRTKMQTSPFIVAIDGTAGSGKGTLARRLAEHFGYAYLDTGKLYRAVAFACLQEQGDCSNVSTLLASIQALKSTDLENPQLQTNAVGNLASEIAKIPAVREALLHYQRNFLQGKGVVVDGRDIGTVVFPHAPLKFFIDADVEVRAKRRCAELKALGETHAQYSTILKDLKARDATDKNRALCPLKIAFDAHYIDTTALTIDVMVKRALSKFP